MFRSVATYRFSCFRGLRWPPSDSKTLSSTFAERENFRIFYSRGLQFTTTAQPSSTQRAVFGTFQLALEPAHTSSPNVHRRQRLQVLRRCPNLVLVEFISDDSYAPKPTKVLHPQCLYNLSER